MSRFFVRTAMAGDLPAISALLIETWHATYDPIYGRERVSEITAAWHGVETLRPRLALPGAEFLVADDGTAIGGMAYAATPTAGAGDCVTLHQLYVRPVVQRRGIGRDLLAEIEASFFDARRLRVEVEVANARALAFYRRHGFAEGQDGEIEGEAGIRLLILEKRLAPG